MLRGGDEGHKRELIIEITPSSFLMTRLQTKLSQNLGNFRAIDSLISEAYSGLHVRFPRLSPSHGLMLVAEEYQTSQPC